MTRLSRAFLLTATTLLLLPACNAQVADHVTAFRDGGVAPPPWLIETDVCILVNEPPESGDTGGDITDPDVNAPTSGGDSSGGDSSGSETGCTDPAGCIDPPPPSTWPDDGGGVIVVPDECPDWQPRPTVTASTPGDAEAICLQQFGSLCADLCACHGGEMVDDPNPTSCVSTSTIADEPLPPGEYHCGCMCGPPS